MKFPLVVLLLGLAATGAMAQSRDNGPTTPIIASPFQALGNVIRNPDADPPRNYPRRANPTTAPVPLPTIIPPGTLANPEANPQAVPQTPPR